MYGFLSAWYVTSMYTFCWNIFLKQRHLWYNVFIFYIIKNKPLPFVILLWYCDVDMHMFFYLLLFVTFLWSPPLSFRANQLLIQCYEMLIFFLCWLVFPYRQKMELDGRFLWLLIEPLLDPCAEVMNSVSDELLLFCLSVRRLQVTVFDPGTTFKKYMILRGISRKTFFSFFENIIFDCFRALRYSLSIVCLLTSYRSQFLTQEPILFFIIWSLDLYFLGFPSFFEILNFQHLLAIFWVVWGVFQLFYVRQFFTQEPNFVKL